jgi:hypothetical protein
MNMQNNITPALLSLLNKGIVKFTYRKVDGSIRNAIGTRNLDAARMAFGIYIPTPKTGRNNPTAYYDIEKEDWRSFKAENVLSINDIDIKEIKGVSGGRIVKVSEPTEVEIPINFGGFSGGMPIGGTPTEKSKPTDFDLGKVAKMLGVPLVKGEFGMGKPIGESVAVPFGDGKGMVFTPLAVSKEHTTLPIGGMSIEDFAKLVAKYVVEEIISRIK